MKIIHGDCLEELKRLEDNSVDAVITDPPYGLSNTKPAQVAEILGRWVNGDTNHVPEKRGGFMGKDWDSFVPPPAVWEECMRVLKPGGHMAVFAGARTQDLMGLSIRLAGFEIRDALGWVYGSGFPKGMAISKAIDKAAGAEREVVGTSSHKSGIGNATRGHYTVGGTKAEAYDLTAPATSEAAKWDGWGTALKPAIEPIILARKPLDGTVAANVLEHGVGGLNIDACRVGTTGARNNGRKKDSDIYGDFGACERVEYNKGRFPANVLLDEHAAAEMDQQSGGGASRFFPVFKYQAKAPKKERPVIYKNNCECEEWQSQKRGGHSTGDAGHATSEKWYTTSECEKCGEPRLKVQHATVKPLALMEWLVSLIVPPGGVVLDPFAGTGTTLQAATNKGFNPIGIEADADYIQLIHQRLEGGEQSTRSN